MTDAPGAGLAWPLQLAWAAAAVVGTAVLIAAIVTTIRRFQRRPSRGWRNLSPPRSGYAAGGLTLLTLMPATMVEKGFAYPSALGFLSPWTLALAATGWLRGRAAVTALVAITLSASLFLGLAARSSIHVFLYPPPPD